MPKIFTMTLHPGYVIGACPMEPRVCCLYLQCPSREGRVSDKGHRQWGLLWPSGVLKQRPVANRIIPSPCI